MQKQDLNGYRTPLDVARRYKLGDIELNTLEIEELAAKVVTDTALSTTSEHPVQNKVITVALNNKANVNSIPTKTSDLTNDSGFVDSSALQNKQDKLIPGSNITIVGNVISSTAGGSNIPVGAIIDFGGAVAPADWLICDGSAVSRTTYATLFAVIGTYYGSGNGSTTFNLPDLRGRVGVGKSSDTEFDTLGETGGEKTHTLTVDEMPQHRHRSSSYKSANGASGSVTATPVGLNNTGKTGDYYSEYIGGNGSHNNLQPYIVINKIIKVV